MTTISKQELSKEIKHNPNAAELAHYLLSCAAATGTTKSLHDRALKVAGDESGAILWNNGGFHTAAMLGAASLEHNSAKSETGYILQSLKDNGVISSYDDGYTENLVSQIYSQSLKQPKCR